METSSLKQFVALAMAAALIALAGCSTETPESLIAAGNAAIEKRDFRKAVILAKIALEKNPDSPEARFLLGKALLELGEVATAEVELRKALVLRYSRDEAMPLLIRAQVLSGQFVQAIEAAPKAQVITPPAKAEVSTWLAIGYLGRSDIASARKALGDALQAQPGYPMALVTSARIVASDGDIAGALKVIEGVIEKAPLEIEALRFRGDLLLAQGKSEQAVASYRKAVELRPDLLGLQAALVYGLLVQAKFDSKEPVFAEAAKQAEVLKTRAPKSAQTVALETQIAFSRRDYKAARELAAKLLSVSPDAPAGLQIAGAIEYNLGSFAQAGAYLTKSLTLAPEVISTRRWLALTYLSSGQIKRAQEAINPILSKIDDDADMLALAGEVYMQLGDAKRAEQFLSEAAKLAPNDTSKRIALALTKLGGANIESAIADLEQISAANSNTVADMALLASYVRRSKFDDALKVLDVIDRKQPNSPRALNIRGSILISMKNPAGARKSYERALEISPGYYAAAANLAEMEVAERLPEAAAARFAGVLRADPVNVPSLLSLAEVKANLGAPKEEVLALLNRATAAAPGESAPHVALVKYLLLTKESNKALSAAQVGLAAVPDDADILSVLGQVQVVTGDLNQALITYGKVARLTPNSVEPYLRLAAIHTINKNIEAAAQSLRAALQIKPDALEAQRGLVELDINQGRQKEALAMARQIQSQRPAASVGQMLEGDVMVSRRAWNEAADAYRAAIKKGESSELAMKLYGVLLAAGKRPDAEKFGANWMKEHPRDLEFHVYAAEVATAHGDYAAASAYYRTILAIQPENSGLLNNLAYVAGKMKQPDALMFAEKANKLAPNQPATMDTLGVLLAEKGQLDRALELFGSATRIAPQEPGIKLNYARALVQAQKKPEARRLLDELVGLGSKFPEQEEVTKLMRQL